MNQKIKVTDSASETLRARMLAHARSYAKTRDLTMNALGRLILNDQRFFDEIAAGRDFRVGTYDTVMEWFDRHWTD